MRLGKPGPLHPGDVVHCASCGYEYAFRTEGHESTATCRRCGERRVERWRARRADR